jgi:hypothetical protein
MEEHYWSPSPEDAHQRTIAACQITRGPVVLQPDNPPEAPSPGPPVAPVVQPTLVIWHHPNCAACIVNRDVFTAVEAAASKAGYNVLRVVATPDRIQSHRHVTLLPTFDLIHPVSSASQSTVYVQAVATGRPPGSRSPYRAGEHSHFTTSPVGESVPGGRDRRVGVTRTRFPTRSDSQ